jgi:uncharacterized protein YndB with AHSA1/START domain
MDPNFLAMGDHSKGALILEKNENRLRFSRRLPHSVETVWDLFTNPDRIRGWLRKASFQLEEDGKLRWEYRDTGYVAKGTITSFILISEIHHTWEDENVQGSRVYWRFEPGPDKSCILLLDHIFPKEYLLWHLAAGWHLTLDLFAASLNESDGKWSWEEWEGLNNEYEKAFLSLAKD